MTRDAFIAGLWREPQVVVGVAVTTQLCQAAQDAHDLAGASAVGLGRLLTAAALLGQIQERHGGLSLQVVCQGRIGQLFADVTPEGHLRGYVRQHSVLLSSRATAQHQQGRVAIGEAVTQGVLSVLRSGTERDFSHSTTELISGEIDQDIEHYLNASEQVPSVLVCDVLLDSAGRIERAAGFIAQGLPHASLLQIEALRESLAQGALAAAVAQESDGAQLLSLFAPHADLITAATPLIWQCRCSYERVLGAVKLLDITDLADMVSKQESAEVRCDFCAKQYNVPPAEVAEIFHSLRREA